MPHEAHIESRLRQAGELLRLKIIQILTDQGHGNASGETFESLEVKVEPTRAGYRVIVLGDDTLSILNDGFSPAYTEGSGAGSSDYIIGLLGWIDYIKPGLSDAEAESFAFKIANRAAETDHPTPGSFSFSSIGSRKGWAQIITGGLIEDDLVNLLDLGRYIDLYIDALVRRFGL